MAKSQYTHDAVATIGEYTDRQTGEKKKNYMNVGKAFTDDSGRLSIKMNAIPVGPEWSGWISLYPARDRQQSSDQLRQRQAAQQPVNQPAEEEDDIPF